jgi:hypothetical protein
VAKILDSYMITFRSLIALMMEAARTSETSVDNYFTLQYFPEDKSELNTSRRENLKSHIHDYDYQSTGNTNNNRLNAD